MKRLWTAVASLFLAGSLVVNTVRIRSALEVRLPADELVGSRKQTPVRRAALYGQDAGQMIADLERAVLAARAEGHTRIVLSYSGKFSNVLVSTATHAGWPMQVIEQTAPGVKRSERLARSADLGATLFLSLRPGQGWTAVPIGPRGSAPDGDTSDGGDDGETGAGG